MSSVSLKWNEFSENVSGSFKELKQDKEFCDVTLASEGDQQIEAHKVILAASSPFFKNMLKRNKHSHPLIYMRGIKANDLTSIVDFIYHGEVNINQDNLNDFLAIAEELQLKGLTGSTQVHEEEEEEEDNKEIIQPKKKIIEAQPVPLRSEILNKKSVLEDLSQYNEMVPVDRAEKYTVSMTGDGLIHLDEQIESMMDNRDGVWTCKMCGKTTKLNKRNDLKRHVEIHIEGVSHPCNLCEKTFR